MDEFLKVMAALRRFCDEQHRIAEREEWDYDCQKCPLGKNRLCDSTPDGVPDEDLRQAYEVVGKWLEKRPVKTWGEWFEEHGFLVQGFMFATNDAYIRAGVMPLLNSAIPDEIALRLGVWEEKECE